MREELISHSDDLAQDSIVKYAQGLSLDMNGFRGCFESDKYKPELQREIAAAGSLSISGTPTFVLGKVSKNILDGQLIVGAMPYSAFESEIKKSLAAN